jgi:hypothetical protein
MCGDRLEGDRLEVDRLEVVAVDFYSGREFVLYFSDDTYVSVSAETLASHFPKRKAVPVTDRRDLHEGLVRMAVNE